MGKRTPVPTDLRQLVLHEGGFRCANPACRTILTLEIHHLETVADGGGNAAENLLALCPNCHTLHHAGVIPRSSLLAWKQLLLALNEAFDRRLIDLLLTLTVVERLHVSGDGVLQCASGIAAGFVMVQTRLHTDEYWVVLTAKGRAFVNAWLAGDAKAAVAAGGGA